MVPLHGHDGLVPRKTGHTPGVSTSLDASPAWSWPGYTGTRILSGMRSSGLDADGIWQHLPSFVSWHDTGHSAFQPPLWDKILVLPEQQNLGIVPSDRDISLEVWSTYRDRCQTLAEISLSGSGNVTIPDPWGEPLIYQPGQSHIYPGQVPGMGDPAISTVVTFTFSGLQPVSAQVTGMRIYVFWPQPDWSETPKESPQWKTEILKAVSTAEQRIKLRAEPRYQLSYRIISDTPQRTALLEAQLFAGQTSLWGVPWWPEASDLLSPAAAGARTLAVDTTDRRAFESGGLVLLWTDPDNWEAVLLESVSTQSVALGAALERSWPAGTRVVPMRKGYMATELPLDRPTNWVTAQTFQFDCEVA